MLYFNYICASKGLFGFITSDLPSHFNYPSLTMSQYVSDLKTEFILCKEATGINFYI